jgi:flagellar export protein FliJ
MKAFQFRLQAVLTLREQAEEKARLVCARACALVEEAAARLRIANAAVGPSETFLREQLQGGVTAGQAEQTRRHLVLLCEHRQRLAQELAKSRLRAEEAGRRLVAATQQREALTRLCRRQRHAHDYLAARNEQKAHDDLSGRESALAGFQREAPLTL